MPYYKKLLLTLFIFPTILLCIAVYLFNANGQSINIHFVILALIVVSILIFAVLLITSMNFLEQEQRQHFTNQLLQQREMNLAYYEDVSKSMLQMSKLRHDFKNHLIAIRMHIDHNDPSKAISYIDDITKLSHNPVEDVFTNNETISAVLNVKRTKCEDLQIPLHLQLAFSHIYQLQDIHIVAILGNLLDNAIEANNHLSEEERYIFLSIVQVDAYLEIICQNPFDGEVIEDSKGIPKSQKLDKDKQHGLGLLNIYDTVHKYSDKIDINHDNHIFTVKILIPNHE